MRTMLRLLTLAVALAVAPARADTKIGFIDLQRALREVDEGKAATALLKKDFEEKQKRLDTKKTEFEKLKADFDKQQVVMSEAAKKEKATELDGKAMELQRLFLSLQKDLSEREREAMRGIFDKLNGLVREVAEADGFSMIIDSASGLVYATPSLDVTNEVVRKYNARFPAGGAKKAEAAKKPAAAAKK